MVTRPLVLSAADLSNDFFQCARELGRFVSVEFHDEPTASLERNPHDDPTSSLVTSIGPSPVRGFIAAIAHPHSVVIWQLAGQLFVPPSRGLSRVLALDVFLGSDSPQARPAAAQSSRPHDRRQGRSLASSRTPSSGRQSGSRGL